MFKKTILFAIVLALVAGGISVAAASSPALPAGQFGNYSFSYNYNTSTISNLSYQTGSGNVLIADNISVMGQQPMASQIESLSQVTLKNGTIFSGDNTNSFLIATHGTSSVVFNLSNPVTHFRTGETLDFGTSTYLYLQTINYEQMSLNVYAVNISSGNGSFYGFVVSNGMASLSNDNTTATFAHSSSTGILIAGFVSSGDIREQIQNYYRDHHNYERINYDPATGNASGRFLNFNFNQSTGVISNFTSLVSDQSVFNSINASGNGTLGIGDRLPAIVFGQPIAIGSLFFYANSSYIYAIHNNPSLQSNFWVNNGTLTFNVSSSLTIHQFVTAGADSQFNQTQVVSNLSYMNNETMGLNHQIVPGKTAIYLSDSNFTGFLMVNNGNVLVNQTSGLITVHSNHTAKVSFVAPFGMQGTSGRYDSAIEHAILGGGIGAQFLVEDTNGSISNMNIAFNSSLKVSLVSSSSGKVVVHLSSLNDKGTNIVIFVSNSVLSGNSKIYVSFDNKSIQLTSVGSILNVTSNTKAYYSVINETNGYLVVIHVPHFSDHTVEISTTPFVSGSSFSPLSPQVEFIIGIIALLVIAGIAAVTVRRRK